MKRKILVAILALGLVALCSNGAAAGILGYNMDGAERGFKEAPKNPSTAKVATDALIGRPVGVVATVLGTTLFLVTLPTSIGTGTARQTGQKLVVAPARWTFGRPLGQPDPRDEEKGVFGGP
jgi:hypothetical protein